MSKKQTHVFMEEHNGIDKRFEMHFPHDLCAYIDYDDVNHPEVDAASKVLKEVIEKYWDEDRFKEFYKEEVMKVWNENEYDLQSDFESLEEYLENYGLK